MKPTRHNFMWQLDFGSFSADQTLERTHGALLCA